MPRDADPGVHHDLLHPPDEPGKECGLYVE
jgi:hypothetical protein